MFHAWGVMEEKEGNGAVARELFKCGVKCDPGNQTVWLTWAEMEERMGECLNVGGGVCACVWVYDMHPIWQPCYIPPFPFPHPSHPMP